MPASGISLMVQAKRRRYRAKVLRIQAKRLVFVPDDNGLYGDYADPRPGTAG